MRVGSAVICEIILTDVRCEDHRFPGEKVERCDKCLLLLVLALEALCKVAVLKMFLYGL